MSADDREKPDMHVQWVQWAAVVVAGSSSCMHVPSTSINGSDSEGGTANLSQAGVLRTRHQCAPPQWPLHGLAGAR